MSVAYPGPCLPPSTCLPPVRQLATASEEQILLALRNLQALYCPLRIPITLPKPDLNRKFVAPVATPIPVDSGYASDEEDDASALEEVTALLRADEFERNFATRWLTSLLARVEEIDLSDDARERIVDDAAFVLSSFSDSTNNEEKEVLTRDFLFSTPTGDAVQVTLNDAPLSGTDHTDVGLQSWGASIVLSSMMCDDPVQFGLTKDVLQSTPTIIELGAGTGLVSLTLAKLLPKIGIEAASIDATDYHSAVLANCEANIATNFPSLSPDGLPVGAKLLDWSMPPEDQHASADLLIASDVVYAPEHASWLRDCAAHLLKPDGSFWLMVTVRKTGKFEGIPETVEKAFKEELCPRDDSGRVFRILRTQRAEKRRGTGRGDETGYTIYEIGWTA